MKAHQEINCTISELHCLFCCLKPKWQYATIIMGFLLNLYYTAGTEIYGHIFGELTFRKMQQTFQFIHEKRKCSIGYAFQVIAGYFCERISAGKTCLNLTNSNMSVFLKSWQKSSLWSLIALWQITRMLCV